MWNLNFQIKNNDSIYTVLSQKHKVVDFMYPHEHFMDKKDIVIVGSHTITGEEDEVKKFIRDMKKHKQTHNIEIFDNHFISQIKEEEDFYKILFAPQLFHITPVRIENGYEEWNIASWERDKLESLLLEIGKWEDKLSELHIKKIAKVKPQSIYFPHIRPKLAPKQKEIYLYALANGYYKHPRKINLEDIAKHKKLAISTVQEHLRKAESKLMPFFGRDFDA